MIISIQQKRCTFVYRMISAFIAGTFLLNVLLPAQLYAQITAPTVLNLPIPGAMIQTTPAYTPILMKGINIHPEDPLKFDFLIDKGESALEGIAFEDESSKLIKYFLAALTTPEDQMWVNLSPYEKDRIIPGSFGKTEMGRDLLAQDYLLKQLTASLMYPEEELGQEFWNRVYKKAHEQFGTTEIPMNTFNKIWIVPETAQVYEHSKGAYVVDSHLKVMLEEDYLALESNANSRRHGLGNVTKEDMEVISGVTAQVVKEVLIPEIEKEVNEGEIFANLRQIYNSVILATWYKQNLKESLLGQVYVDQNKTDGVNIEDTAVNQQIYDQYVEAFKKGVYNYIKEDIHPETQEIISRKYFSGGVKMLPHVTKTAMSSPVMNPLINRSNDNTENVRVKLNAIGMPKQQFSSSPLGNQHANEEKSIARVRGIISRSFPNFWSEYEAYLEDQKSFTEQRLKKIKEFIYELKSYDMRILGLDNFFHKKYHPYFNGTHVSMLVKSLHELNLNSYAFSYRFKGANEKEAEENGIKSVEAALERFVPQIWDEYKIYRKDERNFSSERLQALKNSIYELGVANFYKWQLQGALKSQVAPYFEGSYITALIKVFSELNLNRYAFSYQFDGTTAEEAEENGIKSVRAALERFEPEIWEEYQVYKEEPGISSTTHLRDLQDSVYQLSIAHFNKWKLSIALRQKSSPYFEGSYITALIKSLPELELNPYAFQYQFDGASEDEAEANGIKSVEAALERFVPQIWDEYALLRDKGSQGFSIERFQSLKDMVYNLKSKHLIAWGLQGTIRRPTAPYFNGSYKIALVKSLPLLNLSVGGFDAYRDFVLKFRWNQGVDQGIQNIHSVVEAEKSELWFKYQQFVQNQKSFSTQEINDLKNQIYDISLSDFNIWGLAAATSTTTAPYFEGSHITALIKSFPELSLNRYAFSYQFDGSTEEEAEQNGIKSVQAAIERFLPKVWSEYGDYQKGNQSFSPERLRVLKDRIYKLHSSDFRIWGLKGLSEQKNSPYFKGSYITALVKSFPELSLNPYAFSYQFDGSTKEEAEQNGIKSVQAAIERFEPEIWKEHVAYQADYRSFSSKRLQLIKDRLYGLQSADFLIWKLSGVFRQNSASYFGGSYIIALRKSFPELNLNPYAFGYQFNGTTKKEAEENGIKSVQAAIERFEPEIWKEYEAYQVEGENFSPKRNKALKERIQMIKAANFSSWKIGAALQRKSAPYFEGSHYVALQKSLPLLSLDFQASSPIKNEAMMGDAKPPSSSPIGKGIQYEYITFKVAGWADAYAVSNIIERLRNANIQIPIKVRVAPQFMNNFKRNVHEFSNIEYLPYSILEHKSKSENFFYIRFHTRDDDFTLSNPTKIGDKVATTFFQYFKANPEEISPQKIKQLKQELNIIDEPVIVFGSVHDNESYVLLKAISEVIKKVPSNIKLVIIPRESINGYTKDFVSGYLGVETAVRTKDKNGQVQWEGSPNSRVIINNTQGELRDFYALAAQQSGSFSYIGGTFFDRGHNPIEPNMEGLPVIFGPMMKDNQQLVKIILNAESGIQIQNTSSLSASMIELLLEPDNLASMKNNILNTKNELELLTSEAMQPIIDHLKSSSPIQGANKEKGGIDLNPNSIDMNTEKENGIGLQVPVVTPHMIEKFQGLTGFSPTIINIAPVINLPLLLGINAESSDDEPFKSTKVEEYRKSFYQKKQEELERIA